MALDYPYQAIIFDLDGTLIDSSPSILECFGLALKEADLKPLVPLSDSLIGPPLRQTLATLSGSADNELLNKLTEGFKACYDTEGYKATRVYPGVTELLERLTKTQIPLAIATNKRRLPTLNIVNHLGWKKYFHTIGTLDTPSPPYADKSALIAFLLNEMQLNAEKTLYVGDKPEDGHAAIANNMPFCAVGWGYGEWNDAKLPAGYQFIESPEKLYALKHPHIFIR